MFFSLNTRMCDSGEASYTDRPLTYSSDGAPRSMKAIAYLSSFFPGAIRPIPLHQGSLTYGTSTVQALHFFRLFRYDPKIGGSVADN